MEIVGHGHRRTCTRIRMLRHIQSLKDPLYLFLGLWLQIETETDRRI